jgi:hypothetical protein
MVSPVILGVFVAVVVYQVYKFCVFRPEGSAPGPFRIPVFGSYLLLLLIDHKNLHLAVDKLCKFFRSSVIGFYSGDDLIVVANDPKSVREVFSNPDFDGRKGDSLISRLREPNYKLRGIFFTENSYWNMQRRFTLRNLRDFGFGRRFEEYEIEIEDEMKSLVNMIKEGPRFDHEKEFLASNSEILLPKALIGSLANCFLEVLCGERIPRCDQQQLIKAGRGSMDFQVHSNEYGKLFGIIPWIRFLFPKTSSFEFLRNGSMEMCKLMQQVIERQKKSYEDGHVRNFIDLYIKEIRKSEETGEQSGYLWDQLLMICTDFLFPSLSAIETTVSFLLKHLLYRKDILAKVQNEIDAVVGSGRLPKLDDRVK